MHSSLAIVLQKCGILLSLCFFAVLLKNCSSGSTPNISTQNTIQSTTDSNSNGLIDGIDTYIKSHYFSSSQERKSLEELAKELSRCVLLKKENLTPDIVLSLYNASKNFRNQEGEGLIKKYQHKLFIEGKLLETYQSKERFILANKAVSHMIYVNDQWHSIKSYADSL